MKMLDHAITTRFVSFKMPLETNIVYFAGAKIRDDKWVEW